LTQLPPQQPKPAEGGIEVTKKKVENKDLIREKKNSQKKVGAVQVGQKTLGQMGVGGSVWGGGTVGGKRKLPKKTPEWPRPNVHGWGGKPWSNTKKFKGTTESRWGGKPKHKGEKHLQKKKILKKETTREQKKKQSSHTAAEKGGILERFRKTKLPKIQGVQNKPKKEPLGGGNREKRAKGGKGPENSGGFC